MAMKTRSQRDAIAILKQVKAVQKTGDKEFIKRYAVLTNRLAIMIRQNGLQQALGFISGKSSTDSPETRFLEHLAETLDISGDLTQQLFQSSLSEYMYYTRRCLEVAIWYRRFAESVLGIDSSGQTIESSEEETHAH
jgi:CRISPR type III-B/RAMP module-associated protein Cmr5